ncbi:MAG: DNA-directed RNA polymerase subunit beta' [Alphaproteobacteria bacterium]|nr:DNA-directed RNA polymerase subunit beta' [Alphaproteobacteria bacterium]
MAYKIDKYQKANFTSITISLASPDKILEKSFGEVLKPETINYRSLKPEKDGLFCEKIFGPVKDYECACGKYKRIRYKGIVCDRCGVEVTEKKVRRERTGHIKLVIPIVHIWYFKSLPNKIGYLLGLSSKKIEAIVYYERYVIIQPGIKDDVKVGDILSEEEYLEITENLPKENHLLHDEDPNKFIAKMGAEAIQDLLIRLNLDELSYELRHNASNENSQNKKAEALKRLSVVEAFRESKVNCDNKPEWMILNYLSVIPPDLRPLVPLDGGRFASADLNDLYRRVIIRNARLKKLIDIKAPEVIMRNEKRMLQEAVDSLLDNSRKSNAVKSDGGRKLKSLSDVLKGKQGRFRQNLLGKRVDYSGRSVIVVGPELKMHECGLPKDMAAELFKPFIIQKLLERGIVKTVKSGKKLVEKKEAVVWDILENILKGHPILLNRAPTLHRLSIQAFQPKLVEGKAIQLHPLVTTAFNADFDGDQMAVHVPLSYASILEAQLLMLASHNILNPQNGTPITLPSQDMVLGLYYISKIKRSSDTEKVKGEGKTFYGMQEVIIAYNERQVDLHASIHVKVRIKDQDNTLVHKIIETSVGRVLFNQHVPESIGYVNQLLTKTSLRIIIGDILKNTNIPTTANFLDDIKSLGFTMAFKGGLSFNLNDLIVPEARKKILEDTKLEVENIVEGFLSGNLTDNERYNQVIDLWGRADRNLTETIMKQFESDKQGFNSVYMMLHSGARGSKTQVKQLVGIRGNMAKPRKSGSSGNEIIENPILSSFKEGLNVLDYFISTHGARKGLADTALKTADAGYLTRRLVDVSQDVTIEEEDCNTLRGIETSALTNNSEIVESLADRIEGRTSLNDILNPATGELIVSSGQEINADLAKLIESIGIETVAIRSVLTCESVKGVCVKCYGKNLATGFTTQRGDTVGVIAAQSIGEPGTQLTLRTFHVGGVASSSAVESTLLTKFEGIVQFDGIRTVDNIDDSGNSKKIVIGRTGEVRIVEKKSEKLIITYNIPYGSILKVKDNDLVKKDQELCSWDPYNNVVISEIDGIVKFDDIVEKIEVEEQVVDSKKTKNDNDPIMKTIKKTVNGNLVVQRDPDTKLEERIIVDYKGKASFVPKLIISKDNDLLKTYNLPIGSRLAINENDKVRAGQIIVKIPRVLAKVKDITGGLPRITELFEARNPSNPAIVSNIDGTVTFGNIRRGHQEVKIESRDGVESKYLIPLTRQLLIQDGDFVKAGMALSDGQVSPADILAIKGPFAVQEYLVNEIQEVYRLQGVKINDKHIETIVRQMMKKVEIEDSGDTKFLTGDLENKLDFKQENDFIYGKHIVTDKGNSEKFKEGQMISERELNDENSLLRRADKKIIETRPAQPATARPKLLGVTKASLGVHSWVSAASFQETTKVLSQAAIQGKRDDMLGLKENVITGHLIPAGTGQKDFENYIVSNINDYDDLKNTKSHFDEEE